MNEQTNDENRLRKALSQIAGLDTASGLHIVQQRFPLYLRLLRLYADNHRNDVEKLRDALNGGRQDEVKRLAHTLKGSSSNVGAVQIQQRSASIEMALREDIGVAAALRAIADLDGELQQLIQQLDDILPAAPLPPGNKPLS